MHLLVPCGFPPVALAAVLCLARLRVYQDQRARRGPGGLSNIMGRVLKVFFNDSGPSFSQGVVIVHRGALFLCHSGVVFWFSCGSGRPSRHHPLEGLGWQEVLSELRQRIKSKGPRR